MNKNTIETIQTNTIFRVLIAKIIHGKVNWICQMPDLSDPERSDLGY